MKRRIIFISITLHGVLLISTYVIQALILPHLRFFGLVPLLLPMVFVASAIFEGRIAGGITGLFAGLLCDLSFNRPVSTYTVLFTIIGLLIGFLAETIITHGFFSFFICCITALSLTAFAQMFPLLFYENADVRDLLLTALYQTLYSLAFSPLIYLSALPLKRR